MVTATGTLYQLSYGPTPMEPAGFEPATLLTITLRPARANQRDARHGAGMCCPGNAPFSGLQDMTPAGHGAVVAPMRRP